VSAVEEGFALSRAHFEKVVGFLSGPVAGDLTHGELEEHLHREAQEQFRLMYQEHLDLRAAAETRLKAVADAEGVVRTTTEPGHTRGLATIFGDVGVTRFAYRKASRSNLHPADAVLNLPAEHHSHGLRRLAAVESSRGSFDAAAEAIRRATGIHVGKRQVEGLALRAAADFDEFYAKRDREPCDGDKHVLVISVDGKGVVMRAEALRPATAKAAAAAMPKLQARLSKGEKANRKRMAEVGAVYDAAPVKRIPADIFPAGDHEARSAKAGPVAANKWLTASIVNDAAVVVAQVFDEAERRDPDHKRTWVALVDGNAHQIDRIRHEARRRQVNVAIVVDLVHVLEYLWKAAWCFHAEGDPAAEVWVSRHATTILAGGATQVAGAIRRAATVAGLDPAKRANADTCAAYLTNKRRYLDYPTALRQGWQIATGVIEGACRHLVKDRMDITGARWGLQGAEAILKLRALQSNGDFEEYWGFHLASELRRVHESRYADGAIPRAA
jgi:hypothetical protein